MDIEEQSKTGSGCAEEQGKEKHIWHWKVPTTGRQSVNDNGDPQTDRRGHGEPEQLSPAIDHAPGNIEGSQTSKKSSSL